MFVTVVLTLIMCAMLFIMIHRSCRRIFRRE